MAAIHGYNEPFGPQLLYFRLNCIYSVCVSYRAKVCFMHKHQARYKRYIYIYTQCVYIFEITISSIVSEFGPIPFEQQAQVVLCDKYFSFQLFFFCFSYENNCKL